MLPRQIRRSPIKFTMSGIKIGGKRPVQTPIAPKARAISTVLPLSGNKVYCFWTGDNPLTPNRKRNLDKSTKFLRNQGIELILITPKNLDEYVRKIGTPLHPGYQYLSYTHRADYLRCYFMHFLGGGYTDIKDVAGNWRKAFSDLEGAPDKYMNGYQEVSPRGVTACYNDPEMRKILVANWRLLVGNGCYIFLPRTPLTTEWYDGLIKCMDKKYEQLVKYPARHPREGHQDGYDPNYKYPVAWFEILGDIFHPLCYKYHTRLLKTCPLFNPGPYR